MDNNSRKICHSEFLASGIATCICLPGLSIPCRHQAQTQSTIIETFLEHFDPLLSDPIRVLCRCPFPDCNLEILFISKLSDCFSEINTKLLVKHRKQAHGMDMLS
jgi:hypothetical protein